MTALPVFGGPLKREIVKRAYGMCGQATYEFELEPEEMTAGVQALNDQMATLSVVPYNFPATGDGSGEDESGLERDDILGAAVFTARLLAPTIGKTLSLSAIHKRAESALFVKYNPTAQMELGRNTIRGAGNRYQRWAGPYFSTDTSTSEIPQ